ncbi:MAG: ATP-binding cassette domain-containing protein, partial [Steroidobacteraceae bacterium]
FEQGDITIDGRSVRDLEVTELRRGIGYVIQQIGLFPHVTVGGNVSTVPSLLGWPKARVAQRTAELLELVGLEQADAKRYPAQLSGGQRQRVGLARALAADPPLLLMDEPFGALDPIIRTKAQDDLLAIQRRFGTTIVLVTHDMDEAFRLGARVAVMSQGRLLQYDRPAALLAQPADSLVARMTGVADRALRLLSLTTAGELMTANAGNNAAPGATREIADTGAPAIAATASLRDALSELLWRGAESIEVIGNDGARLGTLTLAVIRAHGRAD